MKKKSIALFIFIGILLAVFLTWFFIFRDKANSFFLKDGFDENNIGEIYFAKIDLDHIGETDSGIMYADNELLVVANEGASYKKIEDLAEKYDAEIVGYIEQTGDYQWKLNNVYDIDRLEELTEEIAKEKLINTSLINYILDLDDQSISYNVNPGERWSEVLDFPEENNDIGDRVWAIKTTNTIEAWELMNQNTAIINPVKVGLIDVGFDEKHEDLGFAQTFYDNGANGIDDVIDKHGTHVAGTMAAKGNNEEGICGIYPYGDGKLYGASYSNAIDGYSENSVSVIFIKCCLAELVLRNVKVINCSFGFSDEIVALSTYGSAEEKKKEIEEIKKMSETLYNFTERLYGYGYDFIIVSAAGNTSNRTITIDEKADDERKIAVQDVSADYTSPFNGIKAMHPKSRTAKHTIVIGAVDMELEKTFFSNSGNNLDIYAPGIQIYSTVPYNYEVDGIWNYLKNQSRYSFLQGTSMASPIVAGAVANVWSINNDLNGSDVKDIICRSINEDSKKDTNGNYLYPVIDVEKAVSEALSTVDRTKSSSKTSESYDEMKYGSVYGWVVDVDEFNSDGDNVKIPNAKITVYEPMSDVVLARIDSELTGENAENDRKTDSNGHFELFLPAGTYDIEATADGYTSERIHGVVVRNNEVTYCEWIELQKQNYEWYVEPTIEADNIDAVPTLMYGANYGSIIEGKYSIYKKNGKYGLIDYTGKIVVEANYKYVRGDINSHVRLYNSDYSDGKLFCISNGKAAGQNISGCTSCKKALATTNYSSEYFYDVLLGQLALVDYFPHDTNYQLSMFGQNSKGIVTEKSAVSARGGSFSGNMEDYSATINPGSYFGAVKNGKVIVKFNYNDATDYVNGIAAFKYGNGWGYFNSNGENIIPCEYDADFCFEYALPGGLLSKDAKVPYPISDGYIALNKGSSGGFFTEKGKEFIPVGTFAEARPVYNDLAWVRDNESGLWGVIRLNTEDTDHEHMLKEVVEKNCNGKIGIWEYNDFDGDGNYEAFAVISKSAGALDENRVDDMSSICFINYKGGFSVVKSSFSGPICIYSNSADNPIDDKRFFAVQTTSGASSSEGLIFGVEGIKCFEPSVSGSYSGFNTDTLGKIYAIESVYPEGGGHVWYDHQMHFDDKSKEFSVDKEISGME